MGFRSQPPGSKVTFIASMPNSCLVDGYFLTQKNKKVCILNIINFKRNIAISGLLPADEVIQVTMRAVVYSAHLKEDYMDDNNVSIAWNF